MVSSRTKALIALVLTALTIPAASADEAFATASAKLEAGDFTAARDAFAKIVKDGRYAPEVFFGLGNSHYRLDEQGPAALAYRRALFIDPSNKEARQNLQFLEEKAGFIDTATPDAPSYARNFSGRTLHAGIVTGVALLAVSGALLIGLRRRPRWLTPTAIVAAVIGLSSAAAFGYIATQRDAGLPAAESAVVVGDAVVARSAPAEVSSEIMTLPPGSLVRVEAVRGKWSYIDLNATLRGWVRSDSLDQLWPFDPAYGG